MSTNTSPPNLIRRRCPLWTQVYVESRMPMTNTFGAGWVADRSDWVCQNAVVDRVLQPVEPLASRLSAAGVLTGTFDPAPTLVGRGEWVSLEWGGAYAKL